MFVILFICLFFQAYLQLEIPTYTSLITQEITLHATDLARIDDPEYVSTIWTYGIQMLIICAIIFGVNVASVFLQSKLGSKYAAAIRHELYAKIMTFSLAEYSHFGMATLLTRTTNDVNTCKETFTMFMRQIVIAPVFFVVAIVRTAQASWQVSLVFAVAAPIIVIFVVIMFVMVSPLFTKVNRSFDNVTSVYREGLTGVRVVRAFNQEEKEYERFEEANSTLYHTDRRAERIMTVTDPVITIIIDAANVLIFFVSAVILVGETELTADYAAVVAGNIVAISGYAQHILNSLVMLSMLFIRMPRCRSKVRRIEEVLHTDPMVVDPENPVDISTIEAGNVGNIEFNDVSFTFPDSNIPALKDISFKTEKGTTTAIIGSTGSGKSTLINLIPRFYDVTEGSITVDGVDVRDYSQKDLRGKIAVVPQTALLFEGTIKDNIKFGASDATDEDVEEALKISQAHNFVMKKENGIESWVNQGGRNFSGGQKQRLAIARAIIKKCEVYVFDDSFSALDFKTDIKVRTALKSYISDAAVIIVAQRVSSILDADNIIVLNEGEIVGQGKHADLYENCDVYREIVSSQMDPDEIEKTLVLSRQYAMEGDE
ncbi:MAG: ABC transporter ATP-binding protein/permease [Coprobacillus sp.]|nr:ABC transporter ATP-binding protein/permease [Coprobacillus sp.]